MSQKLSAARGTECLSTRFTLPTLLHAGIQHEAKKIYNLNTYHVKICIHYLYIDNKLESTSVCSLLNNTKTYSLVCDLAMLQFDCVEYFV